MQQLCEKVEQTQNEVNPEIYCDYKQMKSDIRQQRYDRELLLKTFETLKQQTECQRDKVSTCERRIAEMELQIGMIADTECYQSGFDIQGESVTLQQFSESFKPSLTIDTARLNLKSSHCEFVKV